MNEKMYRIYNTETNKYESALVGSGTNRTQSWFTSVAEARGFNCNGVFENVNKYHIHEYTMTLTDSNATDEERETRKIKRQAELLQSIIPNNYNITVEEFKNSENDYETGLQIVKSIANERYINEEEIHKVSIHHICKKAIQELEGKLGRQFTEAEIASSPKLTVMMRHLKYIDE